MGEKPLCIKFNEVDGLIKNKMGLNIQFLILQMKTKKYQKNTQNFGMGLKMKLRQ